MLIGLLIFHDCTYMNTAFMSKCTLSNIRLLIVRDEIARFAHKRWRGGELRRSLIGDAVIVHFELQIWNHRTEIGISAPLPVTVDRSLNMDGASPDCGQCVGNCQFGVVMGMDPQRSGGLLSYFRDNLRYFVRECSTIGVAEYQDISASFLCCLQGFDCVLRIVLITVKEVLCVVNDLFVVAFQIADRSGYQLKILLRPDLERLGYMEEPRFTENGNGRRLRLDECLEIRVVFGAVPVAAGASKGHNFRMRKLVGFGLVKESHVFGVGTGPPALNVVNAELIQSFSNPELIFCRKRDFLSLGSVTKGCVEYLNMFWH